MDHPYLRARAFHKRNRHYYRTAFWSPILCVLAVAALLHGLTELGFILLLAIPVLWMVKPRLEKRRDARKK